MSERRERRFTNEARRAAGRCLEKKNQAPYQISYQRVEIYTENRCNLRRTQKQFCKAEKPAAVFQTEKVLIEEGI